MTILDLLAAKRTENDDDDPKWVLFVKDHRDELVANATRRQFSSDLMNTVRYDLRRYLRRIQYPEALDWVVLYINDIQTEADFNDLNELLLPSQNQISNLRNFFLSQR